MRHFGSVAKFNEDLSLYLASDRVNNPITYATNDTHVEDDFTNMKKGKRSKNIKNISEKKRRGRKIEIIDLPDNHRLHTSRGSNQRYLSLSYLMQQYRKHSELDPNGLYFLCHMKEVFELASVLDQYPQISLRDKYVWALAPVSIDNVIVMKSYKTYVHQFASNGIVYLDLTMEYDSRVPKDEIILLKYESMHKVFELYIWLSLRFEGHFPDKSDAEKERDICTSLIDKGLMNLGQIRKNTRKRVKRQSDRFDDIKMDAHMR